MIETSQQEFHPMRGHVIEGATIHMDNGDILRLRSTGMGAWILEGPRGPSEELPSAAHVEHYIVHYR